MENSKQLTGGRPKKANKKVERITGRFTLNEFQTIIENAEKLGITKSEYVSKMTILGQIIDTYSPGQRELVLRLINISNNLNQLAKAANTVGFTQVVIEVDLLLVHIRKLIDDGR